jgi:hypothetical protein
MPANLQDFGFRGDIYVLKDSSYHVRRCELSLPRQTSVNFVKNIKINQEFEQLSNGEWVLTRDDMVTELQFAKFIQKAIVIRTSRLSNYSFDEIPKRLFKGKRSEVREPDAGMRGKKFWEQYRKVELTKSEGSMGNFIKNIMSCFTILAMVMLLMSGKWREHLLPMSFLIGYLIVLTMSVFAQAERFHQPIMPLEFMFAAYGLSIAVTKKKYKRWFTYWCALMFVAVIVWNWFKLAGRGLT